MRLASPDVIHGILVAGTNVNTMVVPGYVSQVHTVFRTTGDLLMPCHEFCGFGHSQMLGAGARRAGRPVPAGRTGEGKLWFATEGWSWRICGSHSRYSRSPRCWACGRCGCAARSARRLPTRRPISPRSRRTAPAMAYVLTTFFVMGFGYFVAETALGRDLPGVRAGVGRLRAWRDRHDHGRRHGNDRPRIGALHLLSADDRERRSTTSAWCSSWSGRGSGARS